MQFRDGRFVIKLGHKSPRQTAVTTFPAGIHEKEFTEFHNGVVVVALVAIRVALVVTNRSFVRRQQLGFTVFVYSFVVSSLIVSHVAQIGVCLLGLRVESWCMAV